MHALFNSAIILSIADLEYRPQTVWEKNHMHKVVVNIICCGNTAYWNQSNCSYIKDCTNYNTEFCIFSRHSQKQKLDNLMIGYTIYTR